MLNCSTRLKKEFAVPAASASLNTVRPAGVVAVLWFCLLSPQSPLPTQTWNQVQVTITCRQSQAAGAAGGAVLMHACWRMLHAGNPMQPTLCARKLYGWWAGQPPLVEPPSLRGHLSASCCAGVLVWCWAFRCWGRETGVPLPAPGHSPGGQGCSEGQGCGAVARGVRGGAGAS